MRRVEEWWGYYYYYFVNKEGLFVYWYIKVKWEGSMLLYIVNENKLIIIF